MSDRINPFGNFQDYTKPDLGGVGGVGGNQQVDKPDEKKGVDEEDGAKFGVAPQGKDETAQYTDMQIPEDDDFNAGDFEDITKKGGSYDNFN